VVRGDPGAVQGDLAAGREDRGGDGAGQDVRDSASDLSLIELTFDTVADSALVFVDQFPFVAVMTSISSASVQRAWSSASPH
jgi:hypothetical protein